MHMGEEEEGCVVNRRFAGYSRLASFSLVHTDSAPSILVNKLSCGGEPCQLYHLESHPHMFWDIRKAWVRGLAGSCTPYLAFPCSFLLCCNHWGNFGSLVSGITDVWMLQPVNKCEYVCVCLCVMWVCYTESPNVHYVLIIVLVHARIWEWRKKT